MAQSLIKRLRGVRKAGDNRNVADKCDGSRRNLLDAIVLASAVAISPLSDKRARASLPRESTHRSIDGLGDATLEIHRGPAGFTSVSVEFRHGQRKSVYRAPSPWTIQIAKVEGHTETISGGYSAAAPFGKSLRCIGEGRTHDRSSFRVVDTYSPGPIEQSFELHREVQVLKSASIDAGFLSSFAISEEGTSSHWDHEFFAPGVWYQDNALAPRYALATERDDTSYLIREDRMALPLIMMRDKRSGASIALLHVSPSGESTFADGQARRVIDGKIQLGSLGVESTSNPAVTFCFPAKEGERSYFGRNPREFPPFTLPPKTWVERFHPLNSHVRHSYKLLLVFGIEAEFPLALRRVWRVAFNRSAANSVKASDIARAYEVSIRLVERWTRPYDGYWGLPLRLQLPEGRIQWYGDALGDPLQFQMGFVGMQVPLAYHLLRYGLNHQDREIQAKGESVMDFWIGQSQTPDGLPREWFIVHPTPHWEATTGEKRTFLRGACDGMMGALMAWAVMRRHGEDKPKWLAFCCRFGDWLLIHQQNDGSWCRAYDWNSRPAESSPRNTSHPIRYLVDLSIVTGEGRYLEAAKRAGEYCWTHDHMTFTYVGGTEDNPNVLDKEAAFMAVESFHALHDATGDPRWLAAAARAADFMETWVYCWSIPLPTDNHELIFPFGATTVGYSLIATGHSGADLFMAGAPFLYYRLYVKTGERHYRDVARLLLHATKQSMDIGGSLGFGQEGLCTEALTIAMPRNMGRKEWVPWVTYSMIEPITKLEDTYGMMDTPLAEGERLAELRAKDVEFSKNRGLI